MSTKFFRKYKNVMLVFFGIVLMIAFTVPQALHSVGQRGSGSPALIVAGRTVSIDTLQRYANEADAIDILTGRAGTAMLGFDSSNNERPIQWALAKAEADKAGFVGGPSDGRNYLTDVAAMQIAMMYRVDPKMPAVRAEATKQADLIAVRINDSARARGLQPLEFEAALATARGIQRGREAYFEAAALSQRRMIAQAHRLGDRAQIDLVFVTVDGALAERESAIEPVQAAEFFEKYKAVKSGTGEMGFGYLRPAQVQLEWIKLDRAAISAAVRVDPVVLNMRLRAAPTTPDEDKAAKLRAMEETIRKELTDAAMNDASTAAKAAILGPVSKLVQEGGFRLLPADWDSRRPTTAQVIEKITADVTLPSGSPDPTAPRLPLPAPVPGSAKDWTALADLVKLDGVGRAGFKRGNSTPVMLTQLVEQVKELRDPKATSEIATALQSGVPLSDSLEDVQGNRYFVTVTQSRREAAPASLSEVQDAVVADVKKAQAYEKLTSQIGTYTLVASEQGLDEVAERLRQAPINAKPDFRRGLTIGRPLPLNPDDPINKELVDAVMDAAAKLDPTVALSGVPSGNLIVATPIPSKRGVVFAKIITYSPVTEEDFRRIAARIEQSTAMDRLDLRANNPFSYKALAERLNATSPSGKRIAEDIKAVTPSKNVEVDDAEGM